MGDADDGLQQDLNIGRMNDILLNLQDIASSLRVIVRSSELRSSPLDIRDYRQLFVALNLLVLPIVAAFGVCFLKYTSSGNSDTAEVLCRTLLVLLLYLSSSVGVPLYFGALWAILSVKCSSNTSHAIDEDLEFFDAFDPNFDLPLQLSDENLLLDADENDIDREEAVDEWGTLAGHIIGSKSEVILSSDNQTASTSSEIENSFSL